MCTWNYFILVAIIINFDGSVLLVSERYILVSAYLFRMMLVTGLKTRSRPSV